MRRTTFKALGAGFVVLGVIGAFLPLLPTTIFFILAAGCFARSSPELEARILSHPTFGPPVQAWRDHGAIPFRAKCLALAGMTFGYGVFYLSARPQAWLAALVAAVMISCAVFVATRPAPPGEMS
ncbi:YbaN family protein [Roseibium litorale]|uniref:YbaN family protein n=1 Tax=Roseibium litorale TaxID=2803841 RepID=A0ABR9CIS0_9HYPH|nr:YbaN family protein [Roseibium litorale]MBD8890735.1 YbaN family protein [Roseibium litorale]